MNLNSNTRMDINLAIEVWKEMLNVSLPNEIEYIFTKGSSAKKWETEIDYVPQISDIDIHVKLKEKRKNLLNLDDSFEHASYFTTNYEDLFNEMCRGKKYSPQHLPRIQIVQLDLVKRKGYVVPPRDCDITWIQGNTTLPDEMDHNLVRKMDLMNLQSESSFISSIPRTYMELSGLEYYTLLYKINSRISPSPIRLLTQILDTNPHDVWAYNKTEVKNKLIENHFEELARYYEIYYIQGWELFKNNFTDIELYQDMIKTGYYFLKGCTEELNKIVKS